MKYLALLLLLSSILLVSSCKRDNNVTYDLIVTNSFNTALELYLTDGNGLDTFVNQGQIEAVGELTIEGLIHDREYILRSVLPGNDLDNPLTEIRFTNSDPEILEYSITVQF